MPENPNTDDRDVELQVRLLPVDTETTAIDLPDTVLTAEKVGSVDRCFANMGLKYTPTAHCLLGTAEFGLFFWSPWWIPTILGASHMITSAMCSDVFCKDLGPDPKFRGEPVIATEANATPVMGTLIEAANTNILAASIRGIYQYGNGEYTDTPASATANQAIGYAPAGALLTVPVIEGGFASQYLEARTNPLPQRTSML